MDVSIIIPIYNEAKYIKQCLSSVLENKYPEEKFEILIIDGGSTDSSIEIIKPFLGKNIHLFKNKQKFFSFGANIGIKKAKGDILIFLGGHSYIATDFIKNNLEILKKTKADCVGGTIKTIGKTKVGRVIAAALSSPFGVGNAYFRYSQKSQYVDTVAYGAYRQSVFKKIGDLNTKLIRNQDIEFNARLKKAGGKIFLSPRIKSYYYSRDTLLGFCEQSFKNGFWGMYGRNSTFNYLKLRHYIPLIFVVVLIIGIFIPYLFLSIISLYCIIGFIFALQIALTNKKISYLFLPIIFFILHFSYGLGSFAGFIRYYFLK